MLIFLQVSQLLWMKFRTWSYPLSFLKLIASLWCMINIQALQFDTSIVDLDLHSKSYGYEEARASADILLQTSMKLLNFCHG